MNRAILIVFFAVITLLPIACEKSGGGAGGSYSAKTSALTAATLGEQEILSNKDYLSTDPYASADTSRGERLSMQCRACHSLESGAAAIVGPNLYQVFGRAAGTAPAYPYSEALANSGFVWTPRALDAWLAEPYAFLPGNRMTFPGLPDENDRVALIAYLLRHTSADPSDRG